MISSLELWLSLLGSSVVTGVVGWVFGGKQAKRQELKKGDVEIKKEELDYATKEREYFQQGIEERNSFIADLKAELLASKNEAKEERAYYREKQNQLRRMIDELQGKFDNISLNYALEVEKSEKWMQKFFDMQKENAELKTTVTNLNDKYNALEKDNESLKQDHEALKKEFEDYKAKHK